MGLYFTIDWCALPDHNSYGHDVETAYLMLEAEDVLCHEHYPKTEPMAKLPVDHALVYVGTKPTAASIGMEQLSAKLKTPAKSGGAVEGLKALLLMHETYGKQTDIYFKAFKRQWQFIRDRQVDHEFGGVYDTIEYDGV